MVDGRLKIDIPLSEDFVTTYQAMEKVCRAMATFRLASSC